MKKSIVLKPVYLVGLLCLILLMGSCQKEEGNANVPLAGTQWRLVGFVDRNTDEIKVALPSEGNSYSLVFEENGELSGYTSTNKVMGKYEIREQHLIINFSSITAINELYDGSRYLEAMKSISKYNIGAKGLSLYYDSDNYLLFKPLIE